MFFKWERQGVCSANPGCVYTGDYPALCWPCHSVIWNLFLQPWFKHQSLWVNLMNFQGLFLYVYRVVEKNELEIQYAFE